jgi:hypothetical protein
LIRLADFSLIYAPPNQQRIIHFKVHKQILANHSIHFANLCQFNLNMKELEIPDPFYQYTTVEQFYQFLQLIYNGSSVPLTNENILPLLHCSGLFDTPQIKQKFTSYLRQLIVAETFPGTVSLFELLSICDQYGFEFLIELCIEQLMKNQMKKWFIAKTNFKFVQLFSSLSANTKDLISEKKDFIIQELLKQ